MTIKRPTDTGERTLELYIRSNTKYDARAHILLTPTAGNLLSTSAANVRPSTLVKRLHRLTHAHPEEIIALCERAGKCSEELKREAHRVSDNCQICAESGIPLPSKKISITHVNQAFNVEIQVDYTFCTIRSKKYLVLHIVDCGTGYSETAIASNREARSAISLIETEWLNRHGAPNAMSADDEYNCREIRRFLSGRDINLKVRPVRRHNKTGIVERKNGVLKRILERLQKDNTLGNDKAILSRATFLSNCFSGSKVLSSFELAKGYAPSILGAPRRLVTEELMNAYTEQAATRALQRAMKARDYSKLSDSSLKPGDEILFFFKTTANNIPDEWRTATVVKPYRHLVEVKRTPRGPISRIAYEDIRLRPNSDLARELSEGLMEDYIDLTLTPDSEDEMEQSLPGSASLMSTSIADKERVRKDMGSYTDQLVQEPTMTETGNLSSNEQEVLRQMHEVIGSRQVSAREVEFAPPWILKRAVIREHDDNWIQAYEEVHEATVPRNANVISSHTVYKVKQDEDGVRKLKARLVTHGNRDDEKDEIRKDCSNADMIIVRLLITIALCLGFTFGVADIKGAFLQSGPIKREIFVRPAPEFKTKRGVLWRLTQLPYGIVEAGRQWAKRIESWMLDSEGLERVYGVNQLFLKRNDLGRITLIISKIVDDLLVGGAESHIKEFMSRLEKEFEVGKIRLGSKLSFAGCDILQDYEGSVTLSMKPYMERLNAIELSRARRREREDRATVDEVTAYRSLAGTLMYLGSAVLPQASLVTSRMQQQLGSLRVKHIVDANAMLQEVCNLSPTIKYIRPMGVTHATLMSLSDASHATSDTAYGQSGILSGLRYITVFEEEPIFHPIYWSSTKQRRVTYSSFGAEILACSEAENRGFDMKETIRSIFPQVVMEHHIFVDSKALFDTITTLHECREFRLRKTVTMIRDAFEAGELDMITWIPGTTNLADALTKRSVRHSENINRMLVNGYWIVDTSGGISHDHKSWQ